MKYFFSALLIALAINVQAQSKSYNTKKGIAIDGYDVVAYFNNEVKKGDSSFSFTHDNIKYLFSSEKNLEAFKEDPSKFLPEYGGYCAYAIAKKGKKVGVNPKTYEIRDGKLYLFYNSWGTNTLTKWLNENPEQLVNDADNNWKDID
ncbi:MAG: YHS domain-containing (seleno)protein [bacterium]